ncbi:MAG: helix-turn-helix domain-containing protein [Terrisporobacter sp.]
MKSIKIIENESYIKNKRLEIVRYANDFEIKPAARFYSCSKNTIKKWCKRYAVYGIEGLKDKSRRPLNSPKKIKEVDIEKITSTAKEAKEKKKHITVNNIRRKTKIENYSDTKIKTRGYSPIDKIKEAFDTTNIVYPAP